MMVMMVIMASIGAVTCDRIINMSAYISKGQEIAVNVSLVMIVPEVSCSKNARVA